MAEITTFFLEKHVATMRQAMESSARMIDSETEATRFVFPAYELTRFLHHQPRRDWAARWRAAGESVGWEGALKDRFIALKDSPIWEALGLGTGGYDDYLGNPFPPFALGSGMAWLEVGRKKCEELGLEVPEPELTESEKEIRQSIEDHGGLDVILKDLGGDSDNED